MENILEVINLNKRFNSFALSDINITLPKGYIMGFIGANGAGKTTTIKLIMNMIRRDSGKINIFGKDNIKYEIPIKNKIGYVHEQPIFYDDLTVGWTGNFAGKFYSDWDDERFNELLEKFCIKKSQIVKQLSKGTKMKTALALALSHKPELLILDEPTSGLDPVIRDELLDILMEFIQNEEHGVFFSSHITSDIEKIADYITLINEGRIIFSEEKDKILNSWKLVKGDVRKIEEYKDDLMGIKISRTGFSGIVEDIESFKSRHDVSSLVIDRTTLDDILIHLTKKEN
ncbi:ABC transporter ATP-binding protein [Tepidanaerobacter syntrophicus]|uniref:ABC-2 type transport system ATP-binding protein n=1 Tax=Tepidanaerobacter syntrophicus TaxID=224999 RepID=A0A0U9HCA6_9FIRM|nr:ABC transporter ATP-binding protein [Tepidanaerobacter syntrophicus]GAQ24416.1 ABC-2 type transport system ATP-binding protein [Tepidanaerobacter syntrophicus]GLI52058.1 ABC transporter ATP-binding protein [Tepidanaerobacter syntrophicus]